jgi:cytochrome b6-f complex iron-sulfur subunit
VGGARTRVIDGEEYVIVRRSETSFHALSATCTHSEVCRVAWDGERRQLVCPCHKGVFDLAGNVVSGPPPRPLTRREVVVRNGEVYVKRGPP